MVQRIKYAFIILHYKAFDITADCVDSILALDGSSEAAVIVVDNASGNGSGEKLQEKYKNMPHVKVILRSGNDGYSRANNEGYALAKELYDPEFVIVANNDVEFPQKPLIQDTESNMRAPCRRTEESNTPEYGGWSLEQHSQLLSVTGDLRTVGLSMASLILQASQRPKKLGLGAEF